MRAVSPKRAALLRVYSKRRAVFLSEHYTCQFPLGCVGAATEVHHKRGRAGALLLAVEHWAALCRGHHTYATEHPIHAYQIGISERRVGAP